MHSGLALAGAYRTSVIAVGAPVVVEGLRSIGCPIDLAVPAVGELPAAAARLAPSQIVIAATGWDASAVSALLSVRAMLPACDLVVIAPQQLCEGVRRDVVGLRCAVVPVDAAPALLRATLGLPAPTLLTPRELDVVTLAARGLSNHGIARELGLRDDTVKNYLRSVHRKLGARSRTEAVMLAARAGYPVLRLR